MSGNVSPEQQLINRRRMNSKVRSRDPNPDDYQDVQVRGRSGREIVKDALQQLRSDESRARKLMNMERCNANPSGNVDERTMIQRRYPNVPHKSGVPKTPHTPTVRRGRK